MSDPAIKLFGKTIPFASSSNNNCYGSANSKAEYNLYQENRVFCADSLNNDNDDEHSRQHKEDTCEGRQIETKQEDAAAGTSEECCTNTDMALVIDENCKLAPMDEDSAPGEVSEKPEEEQSDTSTSGGKTLKKPDKIIPCPRCNSMDTKFCYYNNYNVNQPRYFCKNCQRYWTDGGTMRNVPVGAGRRKNKISASHYRHIFVTESLQNAENHFQKIVHHPNTNGTVLTFGSDAPLCESRASVLNLAEKSTRNCTQNGFHAPQEIRISSSYGGGEISSEHSDGSSVTASGLTDENGRTGLPDFLMHNGQGFTHQIACFPGAPWPYPWNPAQWTTPLAQPAFCPPGYPVHFYPAAAYWGCSVPPTWSVPWMPQPSSPKVRSTGSGPNSPTLGKHSRDENLSKAGDSGGEKQTKESGNLWIPKTLRIDDLGDAAKSSIWTTLGIKNNKTDPVINGGLFKAFQSEGDEKNTAYENSSFLQANPAALSRSLNFHESS